MKERAAISYQRSVVSGTASNTELRAESRKLTTSKAFSLVEVTLALAVMAIGLVAILGLIPQGVTSSREAADNTLAATIVNDTFNDLRRQALTLAVWPTPPWPTVPDIYYDAAGTNQVLATSVDRYFHVNVTSQAPFAGVDLLVVTATVSWPALSAAPLNSSVFVTSIARYQ